MLPWKVIRGEQAAETFNPRISLEVADLLPGGASDRMRLTGHVRGHDRFDEDRVAEEVARYFYKELKQLDREPQP